MTELINDHLVMICGKSSTGKSASLRHLDNPTGVMYLGCESGKRLPFKCDFQVANVVDPYQVYEAFEYAETVPEIHTIIIDTQTYLMDLFESVHVLDSADTQKAWGDYAQYFMRLMQGYVAKSTKNVIFTAHTSTALNKDEMAMETSIPVKGQLKGKGIESYFSLVIATKKMTLKNLGPYKSDLLTITPAEERVGFKYVFQTQLTKDTVDERIRGPMGMFSEEETFIDNDTQLVLNRLNEYYS